jgi:hypothetical protein
MMENIQVSKKALSKKGPLGSRHQQTPTHTHTQTTGSKREKWGLQDRMGFSAVASFSNLTFNHTLRGGDFLIVG